MVLNGSMMKEDKREHGCCYGQVSCCCGAQPSRLCCKFCPPIYLSVSTRLMYCLMLFLSTAVMCLMLLPQLSDFLKSELPDVVNICARVGAGEDCQNLRGYAAVYKLTLTSCVLHAVLGLATIGVKSSDSCRAKLHNGFWLFKFGAFGAMCYGVYVLPLMQMETFVEGLLLTSLALLCATGTGYYFLYEMFGEQCDFNRYVIYATCAVSVVSVILSLFPRFGGPRRGVFKAAGISAYACYLTWSALGSEPLEGEAVKSFLNPVENTTNLCFVAGFESEAVTNYVFPIMGISVMFFTVVYARVPIMEDMLCGINEDGFVSSIAEEGLEEINAGQRLLIDEAEGTRYSYPLFHLFFILASFYIMAQLTHWY
ncbi:unnamed protein product, partial [Notodromas monacha]